MTTNELMKKYDVPAPRYTSYPTVPYWETTPTPEFWINDLQAAFKSPQMSWSIYIHIPFCETLCTFCGCNTTITKDHHREEGYVDIVLSEFEIYREKIKELSERPLSELHLGGGTPTFLSPENLRRLLSSILSKVNKSPTAELSIEVDPRRTSFAHLDALRDLGFNRISMGVQDFNPEVQRLVNRIQPFEVTRDLTDAARKKGFKSINFDLIYGLPRQTISSIEKTIEQTIALKPDRIALYSYAHVPWIKPAQRLFTEQDLPYGEDKRKLYELCRQRFLKAGYHEIGMDHFALPTDSLFEADQKRTLHRNFMGYTSRRSDVLLALGVSAISETPTCFHQNEKVLSLYERKIKDRQLATQRGHVLTEDDRSAREQILQLMTKWETHLEPEQMDGVRETLAPLIADGLVEIEGTRLSITSEGRPFLRNACMALDRRLLRKQPQTKIFSQAL